jgi:hypothetical protein
MILWEGEREREKAALNFGQMDVTKRQYRIEEQVYISGNFLRPWGGQWG